jgi:hypothetical protein
MSSEALDYIMKMAGIRCDGHCDTCKFRKPCDEEGGR